jgi:hypothetical protein
MTEQGYSVILAQQLVDGLVCARTLAPTLTTANSDDTPLHFWGGFALDL